MDAESDTEFLEYEIEIVKSSPVSSSVKSLREPEDRGQPTFVLVSKQNSPTREGHQQQQGDSSQKQMQAKTLDTTDIPNAIGAQTQEEHLEPSMSSLTSEIKTETDQRDPICEHEVASLADKHSNQEAQMQQTRAPEDEPPERLVASEESVSTTNITAQNGELEKKESAEGVPKSHKKVVKKETNKKPAKKSGKKENVRTSFEIRIAIPEEVLEQEEEEEQQQQQSVQDTVQAELVIEGSRNELSQCNQAVDVEHSQSDESRDGVPRISDSIEEVVHNSARRSEHEQSLPKPNMDESVDSGRLIGDVSDNATEISMTEVDRKVQADKLVEAESETANPESKVLSRIQSEEKSDMNPSNDIELPQDAGHQNSSNQYETKNLPDEQTPEPDTICSIASEKPIPPGSEGLLVSEATGVTEPGEPSECLTKRHECSGHDTVAETPTQIDGEQYPTQTSEYPKESQAVAEREQPEVIEPQLEHESAALTSNHLESSQIEIEECKPAGELVSVNGEDKSQSDSNEAIAEPIQMDQHQSEPKPSLESDSVLEKSPDPLEDTESQSEEARDPVAPPVDAGQSFDEQNNLNTNESKISPDIPKIPVGAHEENPERGLLEDTKPGSVELSSDGKTDLSNFGAPEDQVNIDVEKESVEASGGQESALPDADVHVIPLEQNTLDEMQPQTDLHEHLPENGSGACLPVEHLEKRNDNEAEDDITAEMLDYELVFDICNYQTALIIEQRLAEVQQLRELESLESKKASEDSLDVSLEIESDLQRDNCAHDDQRTAYQMVETETELERRPAKVDEDPQVDEDLEREFEYEPPFEWRQVEVKRNQDPRDEYVLGEELGRGKFGTVFRCEEKASGRRLAAKFVSLHRRQDREDVEREIAIMRRLQHKRLLQLYDAFDNGHDEMCLVTELIEGGELFERIVDDDFDMSEKKAALFVRQICEGVEYMHRQRIVHLDMKPENILCVSRTGHRIKLIDFGLARELRLGEQLRVMFGTPDFAAPEVLAYETVTLATDMWSVGVICYVLLSGLSPFMGDTDLETMANVAQATFDFDDPAFELVSDLAKDFIGRLIVREPAERLRSFDCLRHPWLHRGGQQLEAAVRERRESLVSLRSTELAELESLLPLELLSQLGKRNLKRYVIRRRWQRAVNAIKALARMGAQLVGVNRDATGQNLAALTTRAQTSDATN